MKDSVNWFEIPVKNFKRAKEFYSKVLDAEINEMPHPELKFGMLPFDMKNGGIGGAIVEGKGYTPSSSGALIYLNGGEDLSVPLGRVAKAGGKVLLPKTAIGENGFMAHFEDCEGNKVAFHSRK